MKIFLWVSCMLALTASGAIICLASLSAYGFSLNFMGTVAVLLAMYGSIAILDIIERLNIFHVISVVVIGANIAWVIKNNQWIIIIISIVIVCVYMYKEKKHKPCLL